MENQNLKSSPRSLELLAPARNVEIAKTAILHGADAVYIGAPSHGARAKAVNTIEDIRQLVKFATPFGVKVYVTVNTIIYDKELADVEKIVWELYAAGVDALIVQDMSLLEMRLPPIQLHASTQCDTRDAAKARWLQDIGMSQIVIARETDLDTIRQIAANVTVPIEAFVHGALCVSYSGDCRASYLITWRSANRGDCAQICRLPFSLIDGNGRLVGKKHYLSLRDMNRLAYIAELADAGVSSFKIEGRLKDASYVKEVTLAYRQALDKLIEANPERYKRASRGIINAGFSPDLSKSFNRGYTDYFLHKGKSSDIAGNYTLASLDTPKALGEFVGTVIRSIRGAIEANLNVGLSNGDGLSYIMPNGQTGGFRANRIDGNRIFPAEKIVIPAGTTLYRSYDKEREAMLSRDTTTRLIPIDLHLEYKGIDTISLSAGIDDACTVSVCINDQFEAARNDPKAHRRQQLTRWGDTIFTVRDYCDDAGNIFIPASQLGELRRKLNEACMATLEAQRKILPPVSQVAHKLPPQGTKLTHHDNVANRLAMKFYRESGVTEIEPAIESNLYKYKSTLTFMETRYCLRRQLGACLKEGGNSKMPEPLTLKGRGFECQLEFDCKNCLMRVKGQAR